MPPRFRPPTCSEQEIVCGRCEGGAEDGIVCRVCKRSVCEGCTASYKNRLCVDCEEDKGTWADIREAAHSLRDLVRENYRLRGLEPPAMRDVPEVKRIDIEPIILEVEKPTRS